MGIENEVMKARMAREQALKQGKLQKEQSPSPIVPMTPIQQIEEKLRRSGALADLEALRGMTGDPNARITINEGGARLIWNEERLEPDSERVRGERTEGKEVSRKTYDQIDPVDAEGRQTTHNITEREYEVVTEIGHHVKSNRCVWMPEDYKPPKEALARIFVETEASVPSDQSYFIKTGEEIHIEKSIHDDHRTKPVTRAAQQRAERERKQYEREEQARFNSNPALYTKN